MFHQFSHKNQKSPLSSPFRDTEAVGPYSGKRPQLTDRSPVFGRAGPEARNGLWWWVQSSAPGLPPWVSSSLQQAPHASMSICPGLGDWGTSGKGEAGHPIWS